MTEFLYRIHQKTGPAPVIRKLGAIKPGMEQTPVIFQGRFMLVESMTPDDVCGQQYIRVRDEQSGRVSEPFGQGYYFASAYAQGDTLYVFATNRWDDQPMTMYGSDNESGWHDPRGGHTVRLFRTRDLATWEEKDILTCPEKRLWNTSVCRGDGEYMMAVEVRAEPGVENEHIGVPFTSFFARSRDLETWEWLPDAYSYTSQRYNACPALRYAEGKYYMICLEELPCTRYAPYIYRTENFLDWEVGFHNPIMLWSDEDRKIKPGCVLTADEKELLETGLNINCSDIDLCEFEGKTRIFYANGDQMTYSFLCEAEYDGPLSSFLQAFFR